jgi:hypothetical protein
MTECDAHVVRYPFEMFAELRRDVAAVCRAWDDGMLSDADKRQLRFAFDLIHSNRPDAADLATAMAIIRSMTDEKQTGV